MDFLQFAAAHGLIITNLVRGKITRCTTNTKRSKRNGAYYFDGEFGWCQDWQVHDHPEIWITDKQVNQKDLQRRLRDSQKEHEQQRQKANQEAIKKAHDMLARCRQDISVYFASKGYPEMCFNVLFDDGKDPIVCVPMRIDGKLSGLQTIAPDGTKKFLYGTNASMATFDIGQGKKIFLCEGLLTGISLQDVLKRIKIDYKIRVCFSAGNMKKIAAATNECFLIVDNDESGTGQRVGEESGKPYYVPELTGEDFNDESRRIGIFKSMQKLQNLLYFDKKKV